MTAIKMMEIELPRMEREAFLDDALLGLMRRPRELPSKYAFDERGLQLYAALCETPEYYPRRSELAILRSRLEEVVDAIGERSLVIQYGGGSGLEQARLLLDAMPALSGFVPVDHAGVTLERNADMLRREFRRARVTPLQADVHAALILPRNADLEARRMIYYPGALIGHETPHRAVQRLRQATRLCGRGGGLIVAVDLKKSPRTLTEAYSDKAGLTAEINLNLLQRMNCELGANFDVDSFSHYACYNPHAGRVEMHLVNFQEQVVQLGGVALSFELGETIWTHSAYVYTPEEFRALAAKAGLTVERVWTDPQRLYSLQYLVVQ